MAVACSHRDRLVPGACVLDATGDLPRVVHHIATLELSELHAVQQVAAPSSAAVVDHLEVIGVTGKIHRAVAIELHDFGHDPAGGDVPRHGAQGSVRIDPK